MPRTPLSLLEFANFSKPSVKSLNRTRNTSERRTALDHRRHLLNRVASTTHRNVRRAYRRPTNERASRRLTGKTPSAPRWLDVRTNGRTHDSTAERAGHPAAAAESLRGIPTRCAASAHRGQRDICRCSRGELMAA